MYFRSAEREGLEPTYIIPRAFGGVRSWEAVDNLEIGFPPGELVNIRNGEVDPNLAHRIATKCVELAPELTDGKGVEGLDIVRHNVGLRPSRHGGPRLEAEVMSEIGLVVHNYGIPVH
jgi:hypothetical protein